MEREQKIRRLIYGEGNLPLISSDKMRQKDSCVRRDEIASHFNGKGGKALPLYTTTEVDADDLRMGHFHGVAKLAMGGKDYAVKLHLPVDCYDRGKNGSVMEVTEEVVRKDNEVFRQYCRGPFGGFIPETNFLLVDGLDGKPAELVIQPWIDGKEVGTMTLDEIVSNPRLVYCLQNFASGILRYWAKTGDFVDYYGFAGKPEIPIKDKFNKKSVFASRNLKWDGDRLYFVDVTSHPVLVPSMNTSDRGNVSKMVLTRDLLYMRRILSRYLSLTAEPEKNEEFDHGLGAIVSRFEELEEKFGLKYRIVGGVAAAAITGEEVSPYRPNGSKRDIDVIVLNPEVCRSKLDELIFWARTQSQQEIFFPELSLVRVNGTKHEHDKTSGRSWKDLLPYKWQFQTYFSRMDDQLVFSFGECFSGVPFSALCPTEARYHDIKFTTFPEWFHYYLYYTRNGGFIKSEDREKVDRLFDVSMASADGCACREQMEGFVQSIGEKYRPEMIKNQFRLRTRNIWETV